MPNGLALPTTLLGCILAALLSPVFASTVTVRCGDPSPPTGEYSTIAAALAALSPEGPHTVTVDGLCREQVLIHDRRNLTLTGIDTSASVEWFANPVVDIRHSHSIIVFGLQISEASGVSIRPQLARAIYSSDVSFRMCRFVHGGGGVVAGIAAQVMVYNSTFDDLSGVALVASDGGILNAPGVTVRNSGRAAFADRNSNVWITAPFLAEDISGTAIATNSGIVRITSPNATPAIIQRADQGILVNLRGEVRILAPVTVADSRTNGVFIPGDGLLLVSSPGSLKVTGSVQNGIDVVAGGSILLYNSDISANGGHGIALERGANAEVVNSRISGNLGSGIVVSHLSVLELTNSTVTANSAKDFVCNTDSHAYGDSAGVGKMACPGFSARSGPKPKPVEPED